ncbi:hypothetical protein H6F98_22025 [Microcoleus sp. FACHB-SPT15]|uniref:hypothetical protein n=1 Tax=Microcoleus sp. FACHB-SPT15 TaxID=2692830 RepID=UPI00177E7A51|nr:hypothetical protein [Microcoleus sp. FACHB-SPT15]MBD1808111.1 hypothetical protein [Microcoleus sp. FACHB-SPT15]
MKHTEWLRLKTEGENICSILSQQGYRCTKQTRRLSWKVTTEGVSYVLTWLPAPAGDWAVIPKDDSSAREQLVSVVQNALTKGEKTSASQLISSIEDLHRPWAIARILPDARHYIVARFFNRQDAEDHKRVLQRFMPAAVFDIVLDLPDERKQEIEIKP